MTLLLLIKRAIFLIMNDPGRLFYQLRFWLLCPKYIQDVAAILLIREQIEWSKHQERVINTDQISMSHPVMLDIAHEASTDLIEVVEFGHAYLILDGNHRFVHSRMRGMSVIKARVYQFKGEDNAT